MTILTNKPQSLFYEQLLCKVDEQILHLQDSRGGFLLDKVHEKTLKHFNNQVIDKPWNNHLLLAALVFVDKNIDPQTSQKILTKIHSRLKELFNHFDLKRITELDVEFHLYEYFKGSFLKEHSDNLRSETLYNFRYTSQGTKTWVSSKLNNEQQTYFEKYLFPMPSYDSRDFSFTKSAKEQAHNTRKSETDAIVPLLPQIRAEGHFRWNQLNRLREAFLKVCEKAKTTNVELPLEFNYDEPDRIGERFYFRLWDKSSFVLNHQDKFTEPTIKSAHKRIGVYSEENNHYFVEFVKADRLNNDEEADSLWFLELFENGVIGQWSQNATDEELIQKRELLNSWGYSEENSSKNPVPFFSQHKGIISPSVFVSVHQDKAKGILFDVEPLFAAATFGLLALDIFTTTGARLNELLQLSNTKECIRTLKVENKLRYSFYAIPKGRDEVESFYISDQTMKLIHSVRKLLKEHYKSDIPKVNYRGQREHIFNEPKPYFFQYHYKAFQQSAIWSTLRFLLHGLHFETQDGKPVTIKTHLLRHAFATEAVQRQKMPIDIVAKILHHRDLSVTGYYSEPTSTQVAQTISNLHDIISDYVDLDEALTRTPETLEKELEEHKEKVGVFNNVLGGTCVTDSVCPSKMDCVGCYAKIPDPEKKHELLDYINWTKDSEKRFKSQGLEAEAMKFRKTRKHAQVELKEIELIEKYREEQQYEPRIQFDK